MKTLIIPDVHDQALLRLSKDNIAVNLVDLAAVAHQALLSINPYTSQLRFVSGLEAIDPITEAVQ